MAGAGRLRINIIASRAIHLINTPPLAQTCTAMRAKVVDLLTPRPTLRAELPRALAQVLNLLFYFLFYIGILFPIINVSKD